jgi:hypothetical protein
MERLFNIALSLLAVALMALVAAVELHHRVVFGHFVPLGLHADVRVVKADIGIPGISKEYDAHITNFGIFPRRIEWREFLSDDSSHGVGVGYRLQKMDKSADRWQTVVDAAAEYCQPYPLGIMEAQMTSKLLWPGQTLSTGAEATGARGNLKGETMRFIVVANGHDFPTYSFTIDEEVAGAGVSYRVRH